MSSYKRKIIFIFYLFLYSV